MRFNPDHLLQAIRRICANRNWQLLACADLGVTAEAFARRVAKRLQAWLDAGEHAEITEALIEYAVIHEYCRLLHYAVGRERTVAQQRALDEVWNYVTPIIRRVLPDDSEAAGCANGVLLTVWRQRGDVRDPGSFLKWAGMIAGRAALRALKERASNEVVFADLFGAGEAEDDVEQVEAKATAAEALLADQRTFFSATEDSESAEALARLIRHCLRRMRAGAEVVIRLVLAGQSVSEVSRMLGMSAANLYVIKLRALARLRQCKPLLAALGQALPLAANEHEGR